MPTGTPAVRVLNTGWYDSEYAGTGGSGSPGGWTICPDIDGHSVWCFQYSGVAAKKINLNTNTVTLTWTYPYAGFAGSIPTVEDGTAFFFQDPAGFVYVLDNTSTNAACHLKKLDPSAAMAEVGSMIMTDAGTSSRTTPESWQVFTVSGSYYLSYIYNNNNPKYGIINLSTMTGVMHGNSTLNNLGNTGWATFVDDSNNVWYVTQSNVGTYPNAKPQYHFFKSVAFGTPGAEQFNIGGTVSDFTLNSTFAFCAYIPGANKCFLGNSKSYTGDMAIVDLVAHTYTKVLDNLTNFYSGTLDAPLSAMRQGWQNGKLAIPGDTNLLERGGIVNFIDPTMTIIDTVDVTSSILANLGNAVQNSPGLNYLGVYNAGTTYNYGDVVQGSNGKYYTRMTTGSGQDPVTQQNTADASDGVTGWSSWVPSFPNIQKDATLNLSGGAGVSVSSNVLTVAFPTSNPYPPYVGQKFTFSGINVVGGPTFLNGQTVTVATVPNSYTFTANFTNPDYALHSSNGSAYRKMTVPFSNMLWFDTAQTLVVAYEYVGSPVYMLTWVSAPTVTSCTPNSGTTLGGTAITNLAGTNFVNGATVTFDGIPATSVTWVSSTQLTCVTPAHAAGAVNIVVTNPDLTTGTLTNGFTYVPPPTVTSCTPSSGPIAGGTAITNLAGTGFINGATVTFGGTPATGVTWISSTELMCITPVHSLGQVDVVVTNPDAQFGTLVNGYLYTAVPSSVAVTSSLAPSQYEDQVTFTATVSGLAPNTPTGTLTFYDGVTVMGSVGVTGISTSAGQGQFTTNSLTPGTHQITAQYSGDLIYAPSTSPVFLQQVSAVVIAPNTLPSFALIASYSTQGDVNLPPAASLTSVPQTASPSQSVTLLWATTNVAAIQITGNNGVDPHFDTGILTTQGSGAYVWGNGWTHTITLVMTCYDRQGQVLGVVGQTTVTIA